MSFKKGDKKSKKSPSGSNPSATNTRNVFSTSPPSLSVSTAAAGGGGGGGGIGESAMPYGARTKLLELFGQIEQQFELMHFENSACKLVD